MFNSLLIGLAKVIAIPIVSVLTFAGYNISTISPEMLQNQIDNISSEVNLRGYNPSGGGTYRLQSSLGTTDTTIKLSSFKEPISNLKYTMTLLNTSIAYGTLDPQQPTRSEFVSFTGITQNSDGTATLTGVTRGLARSYPYTASTTLRMTHSGQSIFILSDSPQHFQEYAVKQNDQTITGRWSYSSTSQPYLDQYLAPTGNEFTTWKFVNDGFVNSTTTQTVAGVKTFSSFPITPSSAPTTDYQVSNKKYVDDTAFAGAPDANTTTKGVVEEATVAEINAGTATGGTGARLYINPAQFQFSTFASTTYMAGTSSVPYIPVWGSGVAVKVATTTSITQGQSMMIWGKGYGANSTRYLLNVKSTGQGTTTLDASTVPNLASNGILNLFGLYTASTSAASGNIEIYVSTDSEPRNYSSLEEAGIMYIRFTP